MAWITPIQADEFLGENPRWEGFPNKEELLDLASNRLEQLTFKDEPIDRVGAKYINGLSVSIIAGSADFLLEAEAGNFAYHELLGWTRSRPNMDLVIYTHDDEPNVVFDVPDIDSFNYGYQNNLTFKQIQSLQSFGGIFTGISALKLVGGTLGFYSSIETQQATGIVDEFGEQVFSTYNDRRIIINIAQNGVNLVLAAIGSIPGLVLDGVTTTDVIDEQGNPQTNTVPNVSASDFFEYKVKVTNGLDKTMFLYIDDILVANPTFDRNQGGKDGNRLLYQSGSGGGVDRHSYIRLFGATVNTENPITIPIRLVGACALLALEYGKFPPNFVGDKAYLENENDYNRMQDLPVNVQAAVEPFLADYESVIDEDGNATTSERGDEVVTVKEMVKIQHEDDPEPDADAPDDEPDEIIEGKRGPRGKTGPQGKSVEDYNPSRLNIYLSNDTPYTTPTIPADTPTSVVIPGLIRTVKDFTYDETNDRWFFDKVGATGKYFIIHLSNTITTSVSNQNITINLYKNGTIVDGVGASRFMSGGADEGNLNFAGVVQLDHLDYIEGYVTITLAGTITFKRFALTINEIVGAI